MFDIEIIEELNNKEELNDIEVVYLHFAREYWQEEDPDVAEFIELLIYRNLKTARKYFSHDARDLFYGNSWIDLIN